jgi:hypothetical protein
MPAGFSGRAVDDATVGVLATLMLGKDASGTAKANLAAEVRQLADELAGPSPSPTERVLAETAAICWLDLRFQTARYAGNVQGEGMPLYVAEHSQRCVDRAHRRFLRTVAVLATVRKLGGSELQFSHTRQQVNRVYLANSSRRQPTGDRPCSLFLAADPRSQ